jgi:thiol-disulfide isomerase/thioredoxin
MLLILIDFIHHIVSQHKYLLICTCLWPLFVFATPDVQLEGIDGKNHNLNDYIGKGKWTVLNIWGVHCPPCMEEIPELNHYHDDHKDTAAIVVSVAIDFPSYGYADKEEVLAFTDDHLVDYPVFISDASISEQIGAGRLEGLPTTYLYTPQGKLVGMQVGAITGNNLKTFISKYETKHGSSTN